MMALGAVVPNPGCPESLGERGSHRQGHCTPTSRQAVSLPIRGSSCISALRSQAQQQTSPARVCELNKLPALQVSSDCRPQGQKLGTGPRAGLPVLPLQLCDPGKPPHSSEAPFMPVLNGANPQYQGPGKQELSVSIWHTVGAHIWYNSLLFSSAWSPSTP